MPPETSSGWKGQLKRIAVFVPQHFAAADMVGRPHQPLLLHLLDQAGGAVIADAQLPLEPTGRRLLIFEHQLAGLAEKLRVGAVVAQIHPVEREADRKSKRLNSSH